MTIQFNMADSDLRYFALLHVKCIKSNMANSRFKIFCPKVDFRL